MRSPSLPPRKPSRPAVAFIAGSYPPATCGIGDYTFFLTRHLAELADLDLTIWTRTQQRDTTPVSVPLLRPDSHHAVAASVPAWDAAGVQLLLRQLAQARPGLVHLQYEIGVYDRDPSLALRLPLTLRRLGIPLVTTLHALDGPPRWRKAHRAALIPLLTGSQNLTVCSKRQYDALSRLPGIKNKTFLIPVGSSIEAVAAAEPERGGAAANGALRLVYFGFVWKGRNIELLLRALAVLRTEDGVDARLNIVGGLRDEAYSRALQRQAAELGVTEHVRFAGDLPPQAVSHALREADVALLPFSTGASTGRTTLMAALDHSLPVVTMGAEDNLSPLFFSGKNMLIAPVDDEAAFIGHVRALARDSRLRARLSEGAARLAESFGWPNIARQFLDLPAYRSVRDDGGGGGAA